MNSNFTQWYGELSKRIEKELEYYIKSNPSQSSKLQEAIEYAVFGGGKRLRPLLVFAAGELFNTERKLLNKAAVAVELIHTYSLVHDDLPCMDNDDFRRGRLSSHKKFDIATALLLGDALQSLAFEVLTSEKNNYSSNFVSILSSASGRNGMCAGQAIDLNVTGRSISLLELEKMNHLKTGALLEASVLMGSKSESLLTKEEFLALKSYSKSIGIAFQIVDDILDVTADFKTIGKTPGKDYENKKPTYVSMLGLEKSKKLTEELRIDAHKSLVLFGENGKRLKEIADFIITREK
tara:strand:+ start:298 stop:1179 length:882 start_codon:yes stop_codon:yes gene_type:complete